MKQRVQIHHLPAMNSTTHRNVSLLLHSTTHCNVSLLLCFWEVRNSKKGGKFMGIDIVLVDEKDAVYDDPVIATALNTFQREREKIMASSSSALMRTDLAEAIGASLLQLISDYISDFDIFMIAYDRETKAGACRRITKHSDFEYCPTPMEHGSFILKCLLFSLSFLSQLVQMIIIMVIDMSGESKPS
ncbi:hypothetical protein F2Q70_00015443 [Brassica cretica]|uniref:Uncharacterized protein n=1 Tax=Brassica cretica TaxID=69181 RepID=A0A8S9HVW8_BRACR|nr:hypothetical protein F2Q70_00015443 [Brassica cretica]